MKVYVFTQFGCVILFFIQFDSVQPQEVKMYMFQVSLTT